MVTVGGSEAIDIAMRAMLDPGDEVLPDTGRIRGGYHTKDKIISASISKQSNRSDHGEGRSGKSGRDRKKI